MAELENINPEIYKKSDERKVTSDDLNNDIVDPIDEREVFGNLFLSLLFVIVLKISFLDLIRNINDPEHPLTLEELHVLQQSQVNVDNDKSEVKILFTPTIPVSFYFCNATSSAIKRMFFFQHCSMATLIGLSIRVKLIRALPPRFKISVEITPGTHASEQAINKQLKDKERVAASLENSHLMQVVNECISAK